METHSHRSMSQKIFQLDLPMEAVSLYLLCCGLFDEHIELTIENINSVWNGGEEALQGGLILLKEKNILTRSETADVETYALVTPQAWHPK